MTHFLSHKGVLRGLLALNDLVAFERPRYHLTLHNNDRAAWKVEMRAPARILARKIHNISLKKKRQWAIIIHFNCSFGFHKEL